MRRTALPLIGAMMLASSMGAQAPRGATHLLVVSGAGGEVQYREAFHSLGARLAQAAVEKHGLPPSHVVFLAEDSARAPAQGRSSRDGVQRALAGIAARARAEDQVLLVLIGHGSQQGRAARFNLPGPDITAAELATLLEPLGARTVAVVNTSSASGEWIPALAGRNRIVITATKSGFEANATLFPKFFVEGLAGDGADADKDRAVSLLEAYEFARRETVRAYEADNRLLTEHAQLDDDGDGKGTAVPVPTAATGDGKLARRLTFRGGAPTTVASSPQSATLLARRDSLQGAIEALRTRRDQMALAEYERELERLLVALATTNRALRAESTP